MTKATIEYVAWLAVAAFFFGMSFEFAGGERQEIVTPALWPRIFSLIAVVVATLNFVGRLRAERGGACVGDADRSAWREFATTAKLFVAPLAFAFLLPRIGFFFAAPLFLAVQLLVLGERRPAVILAVVAGVFAVIGGVFTALLYVALPLGSWEPFYSLSAALVAALR